MRPRSGWMDSHFLLLAHSFLRNVRDRSADNRKCTKTWPQSFFLFNFFFVVNGLDEVQVLPGHTKKKMRKKIMRPGLWALAVYFLGTGNYCDCRERRYAQPLTLYAFIVFSWPASAKRPYHPGQRKNKNECVTIFFVLTHRTASPKIIKCGPATAWDERKWTAAKSLNLWSDACAHFIKRERDTRKLLGA